MAVMREEVFTHRAALTSEYGFTPEQVAAEGFDHEGFRVVGEFPELGTPIYAVDAFPMTRIEWKSQSDQRRAIEAMRLDWEETIGPEGVAQFRSVAPML